MRRLPLIFSAFISGLAILFTIIAAFKYDIYVLLILVPYIFFITIIGMLYQDKYFNLKNNLKDIPEMDPKNIKKSAVVSADKYIYSTSLKNTYERGYLHGALVIIEKIKIYL